MAKPSTPKKKQGAFLKRGRPWNLLRNLFKTLIKVNKKIIQAIER
jgi:hypothetical protein